MGLDECKYLSHTRIETFLQCQKKLAYYVEKNDECEVANVDTGPRTLGTVVHDALENFMTQDDKSLDKLVELYDEASSKASLAWQKYSEGRDMLRGWYGRSADIMNRDVLRVEERFALEVEGVPVVGVIDRVDKINAMTADVTDYKTGWMPMARYEVENSMQLGIYNIAVRQLYPWVKHVRTVYDFIRYDRTSTEMSDAQLKSLSNYLKVMWKRIRGCDKPAATVSGWCRWCDYRHKCEEYQNFLENDNYVIPNIDSENLAGTLKEYEQIKARVDAYSTRKEEIERWIKDEMKQKDINRFEHSGWHVSLNASRRTNYDWRVVKKIIPPEKLDDVISVKKGALDILLKEVELNEEDEAELIATSNINFTQPYLSVKRKRGRKGR